MKTTIHILLSALTIAACSNSANNNAEQSRNAHPDFVTSTPMVHDPVMAKENDTFYLFTTGNGISRLTSNDLKSWHIEKSCFSELPMWVRSYIPEATMHIWAPDIIKKDGTWHLFYSCSLFGKNKSVIGHATTQSLASNEWTDCGIVVGSVPNRDMWNAIDPNIVECADGSNWMAFGSFWEGIMLVRLTDDLSQPAEPQEWYNIASRDRAAGLLRSEPGNGAIEAPFIFQKNGWYYLFVSFDYCCMGDNSTYKVAVGRSRQVTGPYIDRDGIDMAHGGGSIVLEGDKIKWSAVGHCALYTTDGRDIYLSHAYEHGTGTPRLMLRDVTWDDDEWPIISLN